jgi:RNA polymerase sigma factor (sigma-70 family)
VKRTKVLLADDHAMVRSGIRALLEGAGLEVVGEAVDGNEAVRMARALAPQVAFLDVAMPQLTGIEAARRISKESPSVRTVMLSMHADPRYIYEASAAGAMGYVLKDAAFSDLLAAITAVMAGQTYLSPGAAALAMNDYVRRAQGVADTALDELTGREREILQLIAEGRSSKEIGKLLHISARTVDTHRKNIMDKLGVRSIVGLTKFAIRHGLASLDARGR